MKYQKNKTGMIDKVKRSFLRMTSPFEFGGSGRTSSLAFMNVPPEMARRDAAYHSAVKLLTINLFALPDAERKGIYALGGFLFGVALDKAEFICRAGRSERKALEHAEMIQFFSLARNLLGTLGDLADYQHCIDRSESGIASFFGNKFISGFKAGDSAFSNSEITIYNLLTGMFSDAESAISAVRSQERRQLSKSEMERYEKAYEIYLNEFEKLDPNDPQYQF